MERFTTLLTSAARVMSWNVRRIAFAEICLVMLRSWLVAAHEVDVRWWCGGCIEQSPKCVGSVADNENSVIETESTGLAVYTLVLGDQHVDAIVVQRCQKLVVDPVVRSGHRIAQLIRQRDQDVWWVGEHRVAPALQLAEVAPCLARIAVKVGLDRGMDGQVVLSLGCQLCERERSNCPRFNGVGCRGL